MSVCVAREGTVHPYVCAGMNARVRLHAFCGHVHMCVYHVRALNARAMAAGLRDTGRYVSRTLVHRLWWCAAAILINNVEPDKETG